jgi:hypothetical protein
METLRGLQSFLQLFSLAFGKRIERIKRILKHFSSAIICSIRLIRLLDLKGNRTVTDF